MYLVQELDSIHSTTAGERYALKKASLASWDACSGLAQPSDDMPACVPL